jgi:hypothetical protein
VCYETVHLKFKIKRQISENTSSFFSPFFLDDGDEMMRIINDTSEFCLKKEAFSIDFSFVFFLEKIV